MSKLTVKQAAVLEKINVGNCTMWKSYSLCDTSYCIQEGKPTHGGKWEIIDGRTFKSLVKANLVTLKDFNLRGVLAYVINDLGRKALATMHA